MDLECLDVLLQIVQQVYFLLDERVAEGPDDDVYMTVDCPYLLLVLVSQLVDELGRSEGDTDAYWDVLLDLDLVVSHAVVKPATESKSHFFLPKASTLAP